MPLFAEKRIAKLKNTKYLNNSEEVGLNANSRCEDLSFHLTDEVLYIILQYIKLLEHEQDILRLQRSL